MFKKIQKEMEKRSESRVNSFSATDDVCIC